MASLQQTTNNIQNNIHNLSTSIHNHTFIHQVVTYIRSFLANISLTSSAPIKGIVIAGLFLWFTKGKRHSLVGSLVAGIGFFINLPLGILGLAVAIYIVTKDKVIALVESSIVLVVSIIVICWVHPHLYKSSLQDIKHYYIYAIGAGVILPALYFIYKHLTKPKLDQQRFATPEMRAEVLQEHHNRCAYCGADGNANGVALEMDHIIAWSKGGPTNVNNLQPLCGPCNKLKGSKTDIDGRKAYKQKTGHEAGEWNNRNEHVRF